MVKKAGHLWVTSMEMWAKVQYVLPFDNVLSIQSPLGNDDVQILLSTRRIVLHHSGLHVWSYFPGVWLSQVSNQWRVATVH